MKYYKPHPAFFSSMGITEAGYTVDTIVYLTKPYKGTHEPAFYVRDIHNKLIEVAVFERCLIPYKITNFNGSLTGNNI